MNTRAKKLKKSLAAEKGWAKQQEKNKNISDKLLNAREEKRKGSKTAAKARAGKNQQQEEHSPTPEQVAQAGSLETAGNDVSTQTSLKTRSVHTQTILKVNKKATQTPSVTKVDQSTQTVTEFRLDQCMIFTKFNICNSVSDLFKLQRKIKELEAENKELRQQSRQKPLKALENITTRRSNQIAKKIANEIRISRPTTPEGLSHSQLLMRVEKNLSPKNWRISAELDLAATLASGLTTKQREKLKHCFYSIGCDRMASTPSVKELKKSWKKIASWSWQNDSFICLNVAEVLSTRLSTLAKHKQLKMHEQFNGHIILTILGDKGGKEWPSKSTKFGVVIGNVEKPNSPFNITLLAIYDGDDNRQNLETKIKPIIFQLEQLKSITFDKEGVEVTLGVKWYLCSDLKFTSAFFGHRGSSARNPCPKCLILKENLGTACGEPRTLQGLSFDAFHDRNSIFANPLMKISPSQIIPPSFHLIHGISQRIIDAIIDYTQHSGKSIQEIFNEAHAKMDPRKRTFTGAALYNLITGPSNEKIKKLLPTTQSSVIFCRMLDTMKEIYSLADASFLDRDKIEHLKKITTDLYNDIQKLRTRFEDLNLRGRLAGGHLKIFKPTPKLHMLCAHAPQFAETNGWWSFISEQGIEHLHSLYNRLAVQYCNTGDKNKTAEKMAEHQALLNTLNDRGTFQKIII